MGQKMLYGQVPHCEILACRKIVLLLVSCGRNPLFRNIYREN